MTGEEVLGDSRPFAQVVVYPYSSNIGLDSTRTALESRLSVMSKMSLDATALVQIEHPHTQIAIPGETPFDDLPNTTDLMVKRSKDLHDIPDDSLVPLHRVSDGRSLNNTYLQSQGIQEHFEGDSDGVLVVTLAYHAARVARVLKAFGMKPEFTTVEAIMQEAGIHTYDRYFPVTNGLKMTEFVARCMTNGIFLPKGQLPNKLMERTGPRIVDIIEGEDGQLKLENKYANKKRAELEAKLAAMARTETRAA